MQIYLILALSGLLWGGVYLLMATGLNLIYGVMKVVNLAHGDFIVIGGLLAVTLFLTYHISPLVALVIAAILLFAIGVLVQRLVLARLQVTGGEGELRTLLATFGLSYITSNAALLIWGGGSFNPSPTCKTRSGLRRSPFRRRWYCVLSSPSSSPWRYSSG